MTDVIRNISNNSQVSGSGSKPATKPTGDEAAAGAQKANSASESADQVELTSAAQKVDEVIASLSSEPVVDRQKVDAIKTALEEGRYEVNSSVIAEKLIEIDELLK